MGRHHSALAHAVLASSEAEWVQALAALTRLAEERAALDVDEGRWLLRALRASPHVHLGYGSFAQYVERLFGYRLRTTQEKLRVAEALETLPAMTRAIEAGALSWCAARELTRVASPETEQAWLDTARGKTLRELEARVANRSPGDAPDAPAGETPRTRVLRFEVAPDTFATFSRGDATAAAPGRRPLDDDALLLAMARHVLGGPSDEGRSSYQVSIQVCEACGNGAQSVVGELVPIGAAVLEMAACDGQHLGALSHGATEPKATNENGSPCGFVSTRGESPSAGAPSGEPAASVEPVAPVEPALRVEPVTADSARATTPSQSSDRAHVGAQYLRGGANPSEPTPPKRRPRTIPAPPQRTAQTVPPALRRAVLARDHRRCRAPGCTHARSSTCTTFSRAPKAAATRHPTSSPCARRTIERSIAANCSSGATATAPSASGTPMAPRTAARSRRAAWTRTANCSRLYATSVFARERCRRCSGSSVRTPHSATRK